MVAVLHSYALHGIEAQPVSVEVDVSGGLPLFDIVGLPDAAIREARDRVRLAMRNCGLDFPNAKITVNLAPADMRKVGALYDLPILLGILRADYALDAELNECAFFGELSLSGATRPVTGVLPMVLCARKDGIRRVFLPAENALEGSVVDGIEVYPVLSVEQLLGHLTGRAPISPMPPYPLDTLPPPAAPDYADVRGQAGAKRAMEIAAAGGHNLLMIGPPGAGKSMLAKRLPSILPEMSFAESIETTKIHSIAGQLPPDMPIVRVRPFRAPHHTISPAGLSGGGTVPHPGELSLAHNGVLFLDELPEFKRDVMEALRQPVEDGTVTISRVGGSLTYPCATMLVAAMNPCPCGYYGHPTRRCICSPAMVAKYLSRVSGPLLDRLDLHVEVEPVAFDSLTAPADAEPSAAIRARVDAARALQRQRYALDAFSCNARIPTAALHRVCPMNDRATALLKHAFERMGLSARAYDRILKVARTIADLDNAEVIGERHISEAVQYRSLDRKYWSEAVQ